LSQIIQNLNFMPGYEHLEHFNFNVWNKFYNHKIKFWGNCVDLILIKNAHKSCFTFGKIKIKLICYRSFQNLNENFWFWKQNFCEVFSQICKGQCDYNIQINFTFWRKIFSQNVLMLILFFLNLFFTLGLINF